MTVANLWSQSRKGIFNGLKLFFGNVLRWMSVIYLENNKIIDLIINEFSIFTYQYTLMEP